MKRFLASVVVLALVGAVAAFAFMSFKSRLTEERLLVKKAAIDLAFLGKSSFTRMVPGDDYGDDASVLFSGYARDMDKIYNDPEFAPLRDDDKVRKIYQQAHKDGRKDDNTLKQVNERIDYTQAAYKELTGGSYHPVATGQMNGLRVDLYSFKKSAVDGQDRLQVKILVYSGDPEAVSFGSIQMKLAIKSMVEKKVHGKIVQEEQLKLAKVEGGGSPNTLIKNPRKWMADFPPGLMIGYYDFPLFPPTSSDLALTINFGTRTVGGNTMQSEIAFPAIAIDPSWKLPAGASWEAEEMEGTEEEMAAFKKEQGEKEQH